MHTKPDAGYEPQSQGGRLRQNLSTVDEILLMIRETKNDETRGVLLVLQQLAGAAESLVTRIDRQETAFEKHLNEYDEQNRTMAALINKGVGSWRVIAIAGPALMSIMGALGFYILSLHLQALTKEVSVNETQQVEINALRRDFDVFKNGITLRNELTDAIRRATPDRAPAPAPPQRIVVVPATPPAPPKAATPAPAPTPGPAPTPAPDPPAPKAEKRWWER